MLDRATCLLSLLILIEKLALNSGSSKQGKAIRARVGSKSVTAIVLWKEVHSRKNTQVKSKKKKWICTFRTQLIKPGGDTFDFSNYNLRESRIYFWRNEGKILFSSCQSWIMHGAGHSIYMITFILAEKDIEAQRIWATLPGPLASKFAELVMPNLTSKLTKKLVV